jgi:hypothetical protein
VPACGPSHSLKRSQVTEVLCGTKCTLCCTVLGPSCCWPTICKEGIIVATYLSNIPSVPPTLPGPASNPQCSIEMVPDSQGMRTLNSANCAMQLHNLMLTIGRLVPNGRANNGGSPGKGNDWLDVSTGDGSLIRDLGGRVDALARVETTARAAVDAQKRYWTAVQKSPEMNAGHGLWRELLRASVLVDRVCSFLAEDKRPNRSSRVIDCSELVSPDEASSSLASSVCKTFAMLVMPSHSSQPSQAFPLMPFPSIISAKISATRARRHAFSRSSGGSSTANAPWTSSWRHADSLSRCSTTDEGTASVGTGLSAGCGWRA